MKNKIKLLILDVDGILTDGRKYYGIDGMPFAKIFCDKDFTAIKRFRALGINVIFLTGDAKVNEKIGINRNIPVYLSRSPEAVYAVVDAVMFAAPVYSAILKVLGDVGPKL